MNKLLIALLSLVLLVSFYLALQGQLSRDGEPPGLVEGKLASCPASPNCVSSEQHEDPAHFVAPLALGDQPAPLERLAGIIGELGGAIERMRDGYIGATFASPLFGFVDDVELRLDAANRVIHIRSASRVGYGDLGANRERAETLRQRFEEHLDN